jgi:hypothetical protein
VLVFDGSGDDENYGSLAVRYAAHADTLIERLASENRTSERVCVVSTDATIRETAGRQVQTLTSQTFLDGVGAFVHEEGKRSELGDRVDPATRDALERMRRGLT